MRADARRNRARVLEAAEVVFSREGVEAPTEAVARHAGVGIGTVFRHFPTKEALLEALLVLRVTQVAEAAERCGAGSDAAGGLEALARDVLSRSAGKRAYADALALAGRPQSQELVLAQRRARAAVDELLRRAQREHTIRDDIQTGDFIALVVGQAQAAEQAGWDAGVQDRTLRVLFDGLRARGQRHPSVIDG